MAAELNRPDVVAEVTAAFEAYERDLVANDVEALVDWFWRDERAVRLGIDEELYGFEAIAAYRRSQAQATPPRSLRRTVVTTFGDDVATVDTEFVPDAAPAVTGRQSQTWLRTDAGWHVANAHVSWHSGERP
ncbi:MAG: oxalurate catabolism protein HpxZ [Microthrixaceae bacterium]